MERIRKIVKHPLFVLVVAALIVAGTFLIEEAWRRYRSKRAFEYDFKVIDEKILQVYIRYVARGNVNEVEHSRIVLPTDFNISNIRVLNGKIIHWSWVPYNYFYNVYVFEYETDDRGLFVVEFNYTMKYGVLIVEPNAMFLSPIIYHDEEAIGSASVFLPFSDVTIIQVSPYPSKIIKERDHLLMKYKWMKSPFRIWIFFRIMRRGDFVNITSPPFTFISPRRYIEEAREILDVYSRAYPLLESLIGVTLNDVIVQFFVPRVFSETYIIGFVPYRPPPRPNEIYLNLLYFRSFKGMIEYGAVHELVHNFLIRANITPYGLLWVHEGLAEYLGITITSIVDKEGKYIAGIQKRKELLERLASLVGNKYGFVQEWNPLTSTSQNIMYYYAVSYIIFRKLVDTYGGLTVIRKVFSIIRAKGCKVTSTSLFIEILSEAIGDDVYPLFKEWGFIVVKRSEVVTVLNTCKELVRSFNIFKYFIERDIYDAEKYLNEGLYLTALTRLHRAFILIFLGIALKYLLILNIAYTICFLIMLTITKRPEIKGRVLGLIRLLLS
ncbi:MAG: hypothetical protein DRJ66_01070 [Thermoprotei archaeon]|nr:MAG: hypothetical protein DRJ66_01070 [Thermoprotei archaeon]RLF19666.1 MAG: hypothetical protein DRZ82_04990 [Thermoprotei archaeon]